MRTKSPTTVRTRSAIWFPLLLVGLLAVVAVFPAIWFEAPRFEGVWFLPKDSVAGWSYRENPIAEATEKILTADEAANGEFTNISGQSVRVFLSSRLQEVENDLQLFAHPPDLCWRYAGFELQPTRPAVLRVTLCGLEIPFERRIFEQGGHRELVYYAGLLRGKPLPFRLGWDDIPERTDEQGREIVPTLRSFRRISQTLSSRRTLAGAKQFIRVSTGLTGDSTEQADALLVEFLKNWLQPSDHPARHRSK